MNAAKQQTDSFAVIGAGMSGVLAGIKLKEAGHPFTIFEKADRVGGTWRYVFSLHVPPTLSAFSKIVNG